jgi:hypothetical protein
MTYIRNAPPFRRDALNKDFTARFKAQQRSILADPAWKLRASSIDGGGARARRIIGRLAARQENAA